VIIPLAHLTATGFGPWADGLARLVLEPTELLLVIGLVLLGVQTNRAVSDRLPVLLPLVWLLGGLIGMQLASPLHWAVVRTALLAAVGLLAALGLRLWPPLVLPLAAGLAGLFALVAGSALGGHAGALAALLGELIAIAVLTTLLARALAPPHARWLAIGLRVGGSWITAAALLMLGWLLRHPQ